MIGALEFDTTLSLFALKKSNWKLSLSLNKIRQREQGLVKPREALDEVGAAGVSDEWGGPDSGRGQGLARPAEEGGEQASGESGSLFEATR